MDPVQYRVPRYLGLKSARPLARGRRFSLELGYTDQLRREIVTDERGLRMIRSCLQPKSAEEIQAETGLSKSDVISALRDLESAGVVKPVANVKPSLKRYDRHLLFYDLNGADAIEAQKKISQSRIALIGMGGIGSWVSLGLIGAGFKELKLMDFDVVELTNLTRQVLYTEEDIGSQKIMAAAKTLAGRNRQTKVTPVELQVQSAKQLRKHLRGMDMVIVSADRPARIHDWVDEVCIELGIPYLNLGYRDGRGVIGPMTVKGETSCYQCHKPEPPSGTDVAEKGSELIAEFESRYQAPSFGPLNSIVSSIGTLEVIKYITGMSKCRSMGIELEVDPMTFEIAERSYERDSNCWHCGRVK